MQINPGASPIELALLASALGLSPDHFHLNGVLARADGLEGFVNDDQYIQLWRATEVVELNCGFEVEKFAPELLLVGSNGGGEAFAFVKTDLEPHLLMVAFVGADRDEAWPMTDVLQQLFKLLDER